MRFCEVHHNDETDSVEEQCCLSNERLDLKATINYYMRCLSNKHLQIAIILRFAKKVIESSFKECSVKTFLQRLC